MATITKAVVFITGKNPLEGMGGGSNYVRAHARAALQAGFEPHIFCADFRADVVPSDFGVVHCVASPLRPYGAWRVAPETQAERVFAQWLHFLTFSPYMVAAHAPFIAAAVERFLRGRAGPHLIHGFYTWGCVGLTVRRRLRRRGVQAVVVNSVYTTAAHEAQAKVQAKGSRMERLLAQAEALWIKGVVTRYERRAYTQSQRVLLNYDSVQRLFAEKYGAGAAVRRVAYASEAAFLRAAAKEPPAALRDQLATAWVGQAGSLSHEQRRSSSSMPYPPSPTELNLIALQPADAPLIVSVSRHDPRKGLGVLLRALAELRAQGVRFRACLVSGGHLLAAHRRLADELGLGQEVALPGWVPDSFTYLQQADIFVLPSLQEGSGSMALLEALQAGAAIVASNIDGIPEDVIDGDSALLVEPGNVAALSRALGQVINNAALRAQLQRRARAIFAEKFSAAALTEALRQTYAELGFAGNATI